MKLSNALELARKSIQHAVAALWNKFLWNYLNPKNKTHFLAQLDPKSRILDVGCGNDSPALVKTYLPNAYYVGVDVSDYEQNSSFLADEYILIAGEKFADGVSALGERFDAVISAHNLEHCFDRIAILEAMCRTIAPGGKLFMTFPTEKSIRFPSREGTLNYYDDSTHQDIPPKFANVIDILETHGLQIEFSSRRYRPLLLWLVGAFQEKRSRELKKVLFGTWGFWGFEAVIWAKKTK